MHHAPKKKHSKLKPWLKGAGAFVVAGLIFTAGFGLGSGRISMWGFSAPQSENKELPASLDYSSVNDVYQALKNNFDGELNAEALTDGMKEGLVEAAGDPYTEFLNRDQYKAFNDDLNGTFTGIGAELSLDENGNIVIVSPIAGYPAEKAGLRPRDMIVEIDGKSTNGMTTTEAVKLIRGPKDTVVKLRIVRDGRQDLNFDITRDTINIPSVEWEVKDGIGYLTVSRFGDDTADLAKKAAQDFKQQNVKGVVLDLRGNPGGYLNAAVSLAGLWLPNGSTVLTERRGDTVVKTMRTQGNPILNGIPTVVLVNEGSASSSEILAGALRDNKAATVIGEKSFGKGSVQQIVNLGNGSVVKVTIARWFTPGGVNIDKEGIAPDTVVELTEDDFVNKRDPQLDAATQKLNQ